MQCKTFLSALILHRASLATPGTRGPYTHTASPAQPSGCGEGCIRRRGPVPGAPGGQVLPAVRFLEVLTGPELQGFLDPRINRKSADHDCSLARIPLKYQAVSIQTVHFVRHDHVEDDQVNVFIAGQSGGVQSTPRGHWMPPAPGIPANAAQRAAKRRCSSSSSTSRMVSVPRASCAGCRGGSAGAASVSGQRQIHREIGALARDWNGC